MWNRVGNLRQAFTPSIFKRLHTVLEGATSEAYEDLVFKMRVAWEKALEIASEAVWAEISA